MTTVKHCLLAIAALLLTACETVTSPVPVGETPAVIEATDWNGRWGNADGHLDLTVVDGSAGTVHVTYVEEGEVKELDLSVRESGGWLFVNVTEADFNDSQGLGESAADAAAAQPSYLWSRILLRDNLMIGWNPDPEIFVRLVEQQILPGTIDEGSVVLGPLTPEHYRIITSGSHGVVLDWESPMVLYRIEPEASAE
jgi:hypothetical protein